MKCILLFIAMIFALPAVAGGDKNRTANPIIGDDNCIYEAPAVINSDQCNEISASPSGQIVYFCDFDSYVTCPTEEDDSDSHEQD